MRRVVFLLYNWKEGKRDYHNCNHQTFRSKIIFPDVAIQNFGDPHRLRCGESINMQSEMLRGGAYLTCVTRRSIYHI